MKMNYFVVGTNDFRASVNFYDLLFKNTELRKVRETDRMTFWHCEHFVFSVAIPFDEEPATNGNGTMIGLNVESTEEVIRLYNKVLELGGTCEGMPGQRDTSNYSAYVRDLDRNKLCFYAWTTQQAH